MSIDFSVIDELYVLGEFRGSEENSTQGRMGDIRGKLAVEKLQKISNDISSVGQKDFSLAISR